MEYRKIEIQCFGYGTLSGKALTSRSLCYWQVRVWDAKKQISSWSPVARFGVGILEQSQMQGEYIGLLLKVVRFVLLFFARK